ncbi:GNAT family N-acetyltransferase [Streptomyces sp. NPDC048352]|uniref:GNAT family N-acetyltransferase n=1 Tax=Streptomyces sp. NPDC048352 TaxID=3154718 RepID=UPI0034159AC7
MSTAPSAALSFRTAVAADVPALVALLDEAYRGDASRGGWTTEADFLTGQRTDADMVQQVVDAPDGALVVVERAGALVACCQLEHREDHVYFGMFAVRPELQGAGLGKEILAEAERRAREVWGAKEMRMTVLTVREELIAFYLRRGYRRTGELSPFFYGDPRHGIPLRDDLTLELLVKPL